MPPKPINLPHKIELRTDSVTLAMLDKSLVGNVGKTRSDVIRRLIHEAAKVKPVKTSETAP